MVIEIIKVAIAVCIMRAIGASYKEITKRFIIPLLPFFLLIGFMLNDVINLVDQTNVLQIICGMIGICVTIVCYIQLPQLNFHGQVIKGQLLGLKKFIQVAEKNRLEMLVEENPEYFYDILPYAYILGVSDKWIKQFESIVTLDPKWYVGKTFSSRTFNAFASSMQSATVPSLTNGGIQKSSGGTHFSSGGGGGFSGGGSGGGGGGSW